MISLKLSSITFVGFITLFVLGVFSNIFFDISKGYQSFTPQVAENKNSLVSDMTACEVYEYSDSNFLNSQRRNCYNDKIFNYMRAKGLKNTLAGLDEYMKTEQGAHLVGTRCHDIGHGIGIEAVKEGYSSREILETCSTSCGGGCLNGSAHVFITTTGKNQDLDSFCDLEGIDKTVRDMCFHGIGHGLMEYHTLNIVEVIKDCQRITKNSDKFQCGHAAFMDTNLVGQAPLDKIPENLLDYCNGLEDILKFSCLQFGGFLTYVRGLNINDAFEFCQKTPEQLNRICYSRIGESSYLRNDGDAEKTLALCKRVDAEQFRSCLKGANIFSIHTPDSSFGTKAVKICRAASADIRSGCLSDLGAMIVKTYGDEELKTFCDTLRDKDKENCLNINQTIITEPDFVLAD